MLESLTMAENSSSKSKGHLPGGVSQPTPIPAVPTSLAATHPPNTPKKKTSFQITSVTVGTSRLSNDGGDDSADELDESHTDDISRITDNETPSFSEDTLSRDEICAISTASNVSTVIPTSAQYGLAILPEASTTPGGSSGVVPISNPQEIAGSPVKTITVRPDTPSKENTDAIIPQRSERFKVVKIESTEPFRRGRWMCRDYLDHSVNQPQFSQFTKSNENVAPSTTMTMTTTTTMTSSTTTSTASNLAQVPPTLAKLPLKPATNQIRTPNNTSTVISQPILGAINMGNVSNPVTMNRQGHSTSNQQPQMQQQQMAPPIRQPQQQIISQSQPMHLASTQAQQTFYTPQQVVRPVAPPTYPSSMQTSSATQQQMPQPHYPQPISQQQQPLQYPNSSQMSNSIPQSTAHFTPMQMNSPITNMPPLQQYIQQGQTYSGNTISSTIAPSTQAQTYAGQQILQQFIPQTQLATGPSPQIPQNLQQSAPRGGGGGGGGGQPVPPVTLPVQHPTTAYRATTPWIPATSDATSLLTVLPPPGDAPTTYYTNPQASMSPTTVASQNLRSAPSSNPIGAITEVGLNDAGHYEEQADNAEPVVVASEAGEFQSTSSASIDALAYAELRRQYLSEAGGLAALVGLANPELSSVHHTVSSPDTPTVVSGAEPDGSQSGSVARPVISTNAGQASIEPSATSQNTVVKPIDPTVAPTDDESVSAASAVAIDNKIEQAMDLVKSHLMLAVREEVEVLKEKIAELMDRISHLEIENSVLKCHVSPDVLQQLPSQTSTMVNTQYPAISPIVNTILNQTPLIMTTSANVVKTVTGVTITTTTTTTTTSSSTSQQ